MTAARTRVTVRLTVNDEDYESTVDVRRSLADVLREDLELTGTHLGCEHGECGACTVLIDGCSARACLSLAARLDGCTVVTVEGLAVAGALNALQRGCVERHSFQCGFCTPGVLIAATELLAANDDPTEADIREALAGNLCRCTGYDGIVAGVLRGAELTRSER